MALIAVVVTICIMIWFALTRIKTEIQNAATAATDRISITMAGRPQPSKGD
jgi:hypothetical protein